MHRFTLLLAIGLYLVSCFGVSATPLLTNAQRLARGLPLAKPKGFVTRIVNGATRTIPDKKKGRVISRWKDAEPSPSTPVKCKSYIVVTPCNATTPSGTTYYVSQDLSNGLYHLTSDPSQALVVSTPSGELFGLQPVNNPDPSYPWFGFFIASDGVSNGDLAAGSPDYVQLGAIKTETDRYSIPERVGNSHVNPDRGSETDIWSLRSNNVLKPSWVNWSGARAKNTVIFFSQSGNFFGLTSDLKAYNAAEGTQTGYAVTFTIVST
ncbi:hypothetical protein FRB99_007414 [Tulasnella sp. 403]|nr:hypothetical protein FRB99_007414 [Tulasnella sp. 403]